MELTGELKEKVEQAESKEEAKELIKEAGMILSDEELDETAGGNRLTRTQMYTFKCIVAGCTCTTRISQYEGIPTCPVYGHGRMVRA